MSLKDIKDREKIDPDRMTGDNMNGEKNALKKLNVRMTGIPKDLSYEDAVKTFEMSNDRRPESIDELLQFFKNRKLNKRTTNTKTIV